VDDGDNSGGLDARLLILVELNVAPPLDLGELHGSVTRVIAIDGGRVSGEYNGRVLPGGADWQTVMPDGSLEIRARYVLELEDGLVEVHSQGIRTAEPAVLARLGRGESVRPEDYYFRTSLRFRTSAAPLRRLNGIIGIALGERLPDAVRLRLFEIK
jgi:hypothetical protein